MSKTNSLFSSFKTDTLSGVVVFLVALPLCLGIATASGASAFSGIITGIVGGLVVGYLSGSHVSVSGPAASLIAIIIVAIQDLGFEAFLLAGVLAGVFQLILGFAKAGTFSNYIPSGVIQGMLSGIGLIIIFKQIPHAIGYDKEHEGDFFNYSLTDSMDHGYINEIIHSFNFAHTGVIVITLISLVVLIAFAKVPFLKRIKLLPGALVAVIIGVILNELFHLFSPNLYVSGDHLVKLPVPSSAKEFIGQFSLPDFTFISNVDIWITAATIAAVASIATLLTIEAGDRMDPYKRFSNGNTELKAQGVGNILSSLVGGLPMTSVIVRTSANIDAGARTKFSAIFHGFLLLLTVVFIPTLLNKIPNASLAAILLLIGYKLASPKVFKKMWGIGKYHFIPFLITTIGVVSLDLLKGVGIGLAVSFVYILKGNMRLAYFFKKEKHKEGEDIHIDLAQEVSFLNKAAIKQTLAHLPEDSKVIINAEDSVYIDYDVLELIKDFHDNGSKEKNITVVLEGFRESYNIANTIDRHVY